MIKKLFFSAVVLLLACPVFAGDLQRLMALGFTEEEAQALYSGERLSNLAKTEASLLFMPETPFVEKIHESIRLSSSRTFIEALYYIPTLKGASQLNFLNALLKVDTLSGLQYYSRNEKMIKTLIYEVGVIGAAGSKEFLPSPQVNSIPTQLTFLFNQNDETFGAADYEATFLTDPSGEIAVTITNLDPLSQSIFKVADVKGMSINLIALPLEEGMLLYGLITNTKAAPAVVRNRMNQSLLNRLDAFKNWVVECYPY